MQTRRQFGKLAAVGAVGVGTMTLAGCPFGSSVFTNISNYVPIGLAAFQAVVDIIDPNAAAAVATTITAVKAAFADLQAAVNQYNNAPAAQKSTLLGKISTALAAVEAQLQTFWNDAKLPDSPLATTVAALLGVILSTIAAFVNQLPAPTPTPATEHAKTLEKTIPVTPVKRSPKQFKADFNAILNKAGLSSRDIY